MNEPTSYPLPEGERIITTAPMSLERAREILARRQVLEGRDHMLMNQATCEVVWLPGCAPYVRGDWTADQLEALAVWMRAHGK